MQYRIHMPLFTLPSLTAQLSADTINSAHELYMRQQTQLYQQFLSISQQISRQCYHLEPSVARKGPQFSREDLEQMASGEIAPFFGEWFAPLDQYTRLIRMPEPPLLLADRVTNVDAEPGSLQCGTIWTETDVKSNLWYMHQQRMPAGVMIEAGQADLLLVSYLGFDKLNQGNRVYRLLSSEISFHGPLPKPGETLCYDIHITGHAKHGDVRLFFFQYDCRVNGELRLRVRRGQAGFFSDEELAQSKGVVWDPDQEKIDLNLPMDTPQALSQYQCFNVEQLHAFSEGRISDCFGAGFEYAKTHTRTPRCNSGRMLFLHQVTDFNIKGGSWQRGYARAIQKISSDDWFFKGHFKNDPCMPGTLMIEASLNLMAFYLAGLGYTLDHDGWRFEPVSDQAYQMQCRGQVTSQSKEVIYEIFIRSVQAKPFPTLYADILATVDGLKSYHTTVGLRLVPDWPTEQYQKLLENNIKLKSATSENGFCFDYKSILASTLGKPSDAFGPLYKHFDSEKRFVRVPGIPFLFMSRMLHITGQQGDMRAGAILEAEYDVPEKAWYFQDNPSSSMPFVVLLESALQPCGWLSYYLGCPLQVDKEISFRNLDGRAMMNAEVFSSAKSLRTKVVCTKISKMSDMIICEFESESFADGQKVFQMETVFGYFPGSAFENQSGIPPQEYEASVLEDPSDYTLDLTQHPKKYFSKKPALPHGKLLMCDYISGFWPKGGVKSLGRLRAQKEVDPGEWFFKAHFFQDPVQPGSLGLEAMIQLVQFYMIEENMAEDIESPRFESIASNDEIAWKYRGQVVPANKMIHVVVDILAKGYDELGPYVKAQASLWVDNKRIYEMSHFGVRIIS